MSRASVMLNHIICKIGLYDSKSLDVIFIHNTCLNMKDNISPPSIIKGGVKWQMKQFLDDSC